MSLSSWTLPLAVCGAKASPLRQVQIAGKVNESQLLDTPFVLKRRGGNTSQWIILFCMFSKKKTSIDWSAQ